jgi:F420-0:gamma-glutamyl ligase
MTDFHIYGLHTDVIKSGDSIFDHIINAMHAQRLTIQDHDIIVLAESAVATSQGRIVALHTIIPSNEAFNLAQEYNIEPSLAELILRESDRIVGGITGFLLTIKSGHLLPNAGIDGSNAPPGHVTLLPADPDAFAANLRKQFFDTTGCSVGVLIIDSKLILCDMVVAVSQSPVQGSLP